MIVVRSEKTKKILHRFAMNSGNKIANRFVHSSLGIAF